MSNDAVFAYKKFGMENEERQQDHPASARPIIPFFLPPFHPSLGESCPKSNGGSGNPSSGHKTRMGDRPSVRQPSSPLPAQTKRLRSSTSSGLE